MGPQLFGFNGDMWQVTGQVVIDCNLERLSHELVQARCTVSQAN